MGDEWWTFFSPTLFVLSGGHAAEGGGLWVICIVQDMF